MFVGGGGGGVNLYFYRLGTATNVLAWEILITDSREVNEKDACLKISFTSVLKLELCHLCESLLPSTKGLSIYFYVVSSPCKTSARN